MSLGTRRVRSTPSSYWAPDPTCSVPGLVRPRLRVQPLAALGPMGSPPRIGPTGPVPVPQAGRIGKVGAHPNLNVPLSLGVPVAKTSGRLLLQHLASFISSSPLPHRRHGSTAVS